MADPKAVEAKKPGVKAIRAMVDGAWHIGTRVVSGVVADKANALELAQHGVMVRTEGRTYLIPYAVCIVELTE